VTSASKSGNAPVNLNSQLDLIIIWLIILPFHDISNRTAVHHQSLWHLQSYRLDSISTNMVYGLVNLKVVIAGQTYVKVSLLCIILLVDKDCDPPLMAALSSASCKMSSGIWLATRRTIFDDEAFGVEVPTNFLLGLTVLTGASIPSVAVIAGSEVDMIVDVVRRGSRDTGYIPNSRYDLTFGCLVATFPRLHITLAQLPEY
jgi:hypothetical protein